MAYSVITYKDEATLATAITAVVTTYESEYALEVGIAAATSVTKVLAKGGKYTLIDNATIVNVSLDILAKGAEYTVILETV